MLVRRGLRAGEGHRPEFIVVKDDHWARVTARVASPPDSTSLGNAVKLLATPDADRDLPRPVVVVPDHVGGLRKEIKDSPVMLAGGKVMAVRLGHLVDNPELLDEEFPGPAVKSLNPPRRRPRGRR